MSGWWLQLSSLTVYCMSLAVTHSESYRVYAAITRSKIFCEHGKHRRCSALAYYTGDSRPCPRVQIEILCKKLCTLCIVELDISISLQCYIFSSFPISLIHNDPPPPPPPQGPPPRAGAVVDWHVANDPRACTKLDI